MIRTDWIERSVPVILRSRWPALAVVAVVTALSGVFATRVTIDTSLETWFVEDDTTLLNYQEFRQRFGEDAFIIMAVEAEDVFAPPVIGEIARLTKRAEEVPGVRRATSLTNVRLLRRAAGSLQAGRLISGLPLSGEQAAELRRQATSHPMLVGNLVSADGRAAAVLVQLSRDSDTVQKRAAVVDELREIVRHAPSGVRIRISGTPVINDAISRYTRQDLLILTPLSFAVVAVSILLLFRRLSVALVSMAVVGLASLWIIGLMGLLGIQMTLLAPVLIMIILVVGVADAVHIFAAYFQAAEYTEGRRAAMERALRHVLLPCLITSVTTVAGFLSLLSSDLEPIRQFGALAAVGTAMAFMLSAFLIPAAIPFVSNQRAASNATSAHGWMTRLLAVLGRPTRRSSLAVLFVTGVIVAFAAWSIQYLRISANPMGYFRPEDPVRQDAEAIDADLGGAATLEFIVRAPNQGLGNLDVLKRLDRFEVWLQTLPSVTRVDSFGSLVKEVDRVQSDDSRGDLPLRQVDLSLARNAIQRAAPELVASYVQDRFSLGRISARIKAADADKLAALAPEIERVGRREVNNEYVQIQPTGFVILIDQMRSYLIHSQVTSVLIAFGTITLVLFVLFQSWKLALFSMIPNVGPIVLGLALMVVADIPLDSGTVMIATIALGLVVDDATHFLAGLRRHTREGMDTPAAIAATMNRVGRPIILTSTILTAGFGALTLGSFSPTISFGLVSASVLVAALVSVLLVLPAALRILRPRL